MPHPRAAVPAPVPCHEPVRVLVQVEVQEPVEVQVQKQVQKKVEVQVSNGAKFRAGDPVRAAVRARSAEPVPPACPVEDIARAYLLTTAGDADLALRCVIADALEDLLEADRRARERSRLISRGYVRGRDG